MTVIEVSQDNGAGPAPAAGRNIDRAAARRAAADLLATLGADLESDGLRETPRRMVDAYAELLTPQPFRATTFANEEGYDELVLVKAIPFHSLCMHHMLPFHGVAHIGYLPDERIVGLSKLARVVELFARDLQVQERPPRPAKAPVSFSIRTQGPKPWSCQWTWSPSTSSSITWALKGGRGEGRSQDSISGCVKCAW